MTPTGTVVATLVGVAASALAACGEPARAQPAAGSAAAPSVSVSRPPATLPAGWTRLPQVEHDVQRALAAAPPLMATTAPVLAAYGDPAAGCTALWIATTRPGRTTLAAEVASVASATQRLGSSALPPVAAGASSWTGELNLEVGAQRGKANVTVALTPPKGAALAAVVCLAGAREPRYCADACAPLLTQGPPRSTP
jgi:hypothetical protein